jgi:hypothetical protein
MGKVFKALDERLEEVIVLKVMKIPSAATPGSSSSSSARSASPEDPHPGVVRIHDFWDAGPSAS